jgi:hypothetical protein
MLNRLRQAQADKIFQTDTTGFYKLDNFKYISTPKSKYMNKKISLLFSGVILAILITIFAFTSKGSKSSTTIEKKAATSTINSKSHCPLEGTPLCPKKDCSLIGTPDCPMVGPDCPFAGNKDCSMDEATDCNTDSDVPKCCKKKK